MLNAPVWSSWDAMHYRLASLWELLMHQFDAGKFFPAFNSTTNLGQMILGLEGKKPNATFTLPQREFDENCAHFDALISELSNADLRGAASSAKEVLTEFKTKGVPVQIPAEAGGQGVHFPHGSTVRIRRSIQDLGTLIRAEFIGRHVLIVPAAKAGHYSPEEPLFGLDVDAKFKKKARREIDQAGKCLALGMDTACVFHLMRTIEVAIEAMRICLGLPEPTKGQHKAWGAVLDRFRTEIEGRDNLAWPRQWNSMDDKKFFERMYASLIAIKNAWRDDTMHVESDYNEREAAHIFALTKGFMEIVASRLDENGQPLAWPLS